MIYCGFLVSFAVKHEIYLLLASIWNKLSPYIAKGHTQKKKKKNISKIKVDWSLSKHCKYLIIL